MKTREVAARDYELPRKRLDGAMAVSKQSLSGRHKKSGQTKKSGLLLVCGILFLVYVSAAGVLFVWQQSQIVRISYDIRELSRRESDLAEENRGLRLRVAKREAPAQVEAVATGRLGMVEPEPWQIVRVNVEPFRQLLDP